MTNPFTSFPDQSGYLTCEPRRMDGDELQGASVRVCALSLSKGHAFQSDFSQLMQMDEI